MIRILVGRYGLEYDSDYGDAHRSGWSATVDGSYRVQLGSFLDALRALVEAQ